MAIDSNLIELIKAIIWPVLIFLILGIFLIFPKSIKTLIYMVSRVTSRFSFAGATIEFARVNEFKSSLEQIFSEIDSLKSISGGSEPSILLDLIRLLKKDSTADYFVINLENGDKWITSRLYIFSIILQRMRGLRCFVFVETTQNVRNRFVGIAETDKVRWALARKYPWLEKAFNKAIWNYDVTSLNGAIDENQIEQPIGTFIESIRYTKELVDNKPKEFQEIHGISTPDSNPREWISISKYTIKKEPIGSDRLFNWDNVPGNDTYMLLQYLNQIIAINWDAKITNINNTIQISSNKDSVEITFDENSKTAMLRINNGPAYKLLADDKRNIYKKTFERARWLKSINIEHLLGEYLNKAAMIDSPNISEEEKEKFILSKDANFVAILNNDHSFDRLIDRSKLVEKIAKSSIGYS
jgi:hypothetical protein